MPQALRRKSSTPPRRAGHSSTTLAAFVGETVPLRREPRDTAKIRVFHGGRFVCQAVCTELAGATISSF